MTTSEVREFYKREDVQVILTTAPAGLGHVRVTEAIRLGLPKDVRSEIVGIKDPSIQWLHRVASRDHRLRAGMEFVQNNPMFEETFTRWYRKRLRSKSTEAYNRLHALIKRRRPVPRAVIVVSTHFSLAHQIAEVKDQLSEELGVCVVLAVIDTDDSPQNIWAVNGADYLFVPSGSTKEALLKYFNRFTKNVPELIVSPYPISKTFADMLSEADYAERAEQLKPTSKRKLQVIIPISGAAVQLGYFQDLITTIGYGGFSDVTVVARDSSYTKSFLTWCQRHPSVNVAGDERDRDVVLEYERLYRSSVFAVEITKPSEQSFKSLVTPKQRGGVILLFSDPVGRQEDDNVSFLRRHRLMPTVEEQEHLEKLVQMKPATIDPQILTRAHEWRGIMLPTSGVKAGEMIVQLRELGVLEAMAQFSGYVDHPELRGDGVKLFWRAIAEKVLIHCMLGQESP